MTTPTDGYGIYEGIQASVGQATWGPRLDAIAAGGFKLVMNYSLLKGSVSDVTAYINYAASKGLKVIISLENPTIWDLTAHPTSADLAALFPTMYAAAGSPTSNWDQTFTQFVVNSFKALSGTWGYYIGDEPTSAQHTNLHNHAGFVSSADATHPRLIIVQGNGANPVGGGTNLFYDCCEVLGDDWYPITSSAPVSLSDLATEAIQVQNFTNGKNIQSALALQAHSLSVSTGHPGAPWPTESQMLSMRNTVAASMQPRLVLWYSYYDVIQTGSPDFAPALQWSYLQSAILGKSTMALFPTATRRGSPSTTSYVTTVLADSPTAYYRLNEAVGSTNAVDSTSNHYNGAISSNVTAGQSGPIVSPADTAMLFSGGFITLPTATNGAGWSTLSFEVWFKLTSLPTAFENVVGAYTTATNSGYQLFLNTTGLLEFTVGNGTTNVTASYAPGWSTNTWYYVVGTWDGTTIRLYVNSPSALATASLSGTVGNAGVAPRIGSTANGSSTFLGTIGQVGIYHACLSPAQITNHTRTGNGSLLSTSALFPPAIRRSTN